MDMITVSAKTLDEAITKALLELQTTSEHLHYEIVQKESSGFLGLFGAKPCVIRARVMSEEEEKALKKAAYEKEKAERAAAKAAEKPVQKPSDKQDKPAKKEADNKKEFDNKREERKEFQKRDAEKRDGEKKENERKDFDKKPFEKKDGERKNFERKNFEKRNSEKRESGRKDFEKKNSDKSFEKNFDKNSERNPERNFEKKRQEKPEAEVKPAEGKAEKEQKAKPPVNVDEALIRKNAKEFLEQVFGAMGMEVSIDTVYNAEEGELLVMMEGDDMGILIGKRGQTLDSLQYLVSLVVNKETDGYLRVKLDTENYRERRKETLETLAKNISYKVKRTKRPVSLEPMNPYERRIIHSALQNDRYVVTRSEGEDPYRHVVISLKRESYNGGGRKDRYNSRRDRDRNAEKNADRNREKNAEKQLEKAAEKQTETVSEA